MAVTRTITVGDIPVTLKASAAVPRLYRIKFGRDIYHDLQELEKSISQSDENASTLDAFSLELFENIGYIFNKHGDPENVPDNVDEWLEQFDTFSIYTILPEIIGLWGLNLQTNVEAKTNFKKAAGS